MSNPTRQELIEAMQKVLREWSNSTTQKLPIEVVADAVLALLAEPGALTAVAWRVEVPTTHNGMFALLYDNEDHARADYGAMPEAFISPLFAAASPVVPEPAALTETTVKALIRVLSDAPWLDEVNRDFLPNTARFIAARWPLSASATEGTSE